VLRILPQKPLEVVSVQAAAGSIIHKAMRVFYQSRKVELEEYRATSMLLWEYTEMEWEHGPFSAARGVGGGEGALDIKQEQMERSTIPETTLSMISCTMPPHNGRLTSVLAGLLMLIMPNIAEAQLQQGAAPPPPAPPSR
jgi:hypothetical protein